LRGTQFRQWATKRLHEYIIKGFTMDDERLKKLGGGGYWKEESILFFKMVQNKLHYAVNEQTAAEIIYSRVDADQEFMGLKTFSGSFPIKKDISVAKNYLNKEELFKLMIIRIYT